MLKILLIGFIWIMNIYYFIDFIQEYRKADKQRRKLIIKLCFVWFIIVSVLGWACYDAISKYNHWLQIDIKG